MFGARGVRLAGALALLVMLVAPGLPGATGTRVEAHAQLVASSPGAGTAVAEAPSEIRLVFSEPLEAQLTSADLRSADGEVLLDRAGQIDPDDPFALVLQAPPLADGAYAVTWRSLSAADGHTAEGFFSFSVGEAAADPDLGVAAAIHDQPTGVDLLWRWLTYAGLLAALGIPIFHAVVIRGGPMPAALTRLLAAGLLVAAGATLVAGVLSGLEAGAVGDYLLATRNGLLQLARAGVAALGGFALLVAPAAVSRAVAILAGVVGLALLVAAGHAAALPGPVPLLGQVVHVAAAGVWVGGIASVFLLFIRPRLLVGDGAPPPMSVCIPRFSALALASIGLVAGSGVFAALTQSGALLSLETDYGRALALKLALVGGALLLGGLNYLDGGRLRGWLDGMRTRVSAELFVVGAILLITASLAATQPSTQAAGAAIEPIPDAFGDVTPGMGMEVVPGRPGVNRIVVTTTDALAASRNLKLELGLDRLDDGSTSRVPLTDAEAGGGGHAAHGGGAADGATDDGSTEWMADGVVLPADTRWDASVRILSSSGTELSRQRFAFALGDDRIDEGRATNLLEPTTAVAILLVFGGAIGIGLGAGGARLPRCEPAASRLALTAGGGAATILGVAIGVERLIGL